MDKEDVVNTNNGVLALKMSERMPFAAIWMQLEIIILSDVRQIAYDITYMWNLKK